MTGKDETVVSLRELMDEFFKMEKVEDVNIRTKKWFLSTP